MVVTTEADGEPNAASIGIIKSGMEVKVRLFSGTHTYENVIANGALVANVTHDPMVVVETALGDLPPDRFQRRHGQLTLKDAESWAQFRCEPFRLDILIETLEFVQGEVIRRDFRAINRGLSGVVEAAIAATRFFALNQESYLDEIRRIGRIVGRCGGPREIAAMDLLVERLDDFY